MSSWFFHVFTDENPELKKQIGCMNGVFQIFDRQHLVNGKSLNGKHKKHPSGNVHTSAIPRVEHGGGSPKTVLEKVYSKSSGENQKVSMESSTTSFSSSSRSSFSSFECSKATQQEPLSFEQTNPPDLKTSNAPVQKACRSLDFRDVVKDSINRDSRGLSVKTTPKEEVKTRVLRHIDSPRPMQLSKSMDGSYIIGINGKPRDPPHLNESVQVLVKLKEPQRNLSESRESPGSSFEVARTCSFHPESREVHCLSFDSELSSKRTELPRLSLDSREGSLRHSNLDSKLDSIFKGLDRSHSNREISKSPNSNSVVAKLMGLETIPSYSREECDSSVKQKPGSLKISQDSKQDFHSCSPKNSLKGSISPIVKDLDSVKKPIHNSTVSVETATWRRQEKCQVQPKAKLKKQSVYVEIEERLKSPELRNSINDLMTVQQLLDAMQTKGFIDTKKSGEKNQKVVPPENLQSPIVIMKPTKSVKRLGASATSSVCRMEGLSDKKLQNNNAVDTKKAKNQTSGVSFRELSNRRTSERTEDKPRSRSTRKNGGSSLKTSGSLNPRQQQKRIDAEKSRSPLPSSDSGKPQKASADKKPLRSVSPKSKIRQKPAQVRNRDEQLSERIERKNFGYQGDDISQRSDSNISLESQLDILVKQKKSSSVSLGEEVSTPEFVIAPAREQEQPSPVSVLDASFYQDELPSPPLMKRLNCPTGEKNHISDDFWMQSGLLETLTQNSVFEINQKKLLGIENLQVHSFKALSSTDDGLCNTNHISSLSETDNLDHLYVSEILLASGLLFKDLNSFPFSPIHPALFLTLEKTTRSRLSKPEFETDQEKLHRKLIFDVVNELLIEKLKLTSSTPYSKLSRRFPSGQQLLKELCSEIDRLKAETKKSENSDDNDDEIKISDEEVLRVSKEWTDFGKEDSGLVLDIERLIFKDLIDELLSGKVFALQFKSSSKRQAAKVFFSEVNL